MSPPPSSSSSSSSTTPSAENPLSTKAAIPPPTTTTTIADNFDNDSDVIIPPHFGETMHRMVTYGAEHVPDTIQWTAMGTAFDVSRQTIVQQTQWIELWKSFFPTVSSSSDFEYLLILHGWWERTVISRNNNTDNNHPDNHHNVGGGRTTESQNIIIIKSQYWNAHFHRDRNTPEQLALIRPEPSVRSFNFRDRALQQQQQHHHHPTSRVTPSETPPTQAITTTTTTTTSSTNIHNPQEMSHQTNPLHHDPLNDSVELLGSTRPVSSEHAPILPSNPTINVNAEHQPPQAALLQPIIGKETQGMVVEPVLESRQFPSLPPRPSIPTFLSSSASTETDTRVVRQFAEMIMRNMMAMASPETISRHEDEFQHLALSSSPRFALPSAEFAPVITRKAVIAAPSPSEDEDDNMNVAHHETNNSTNDADESNSLLCNEEMPEYNESSVVDLELETNDDATEEHEKVDRYSEFKLSPNFAEQSPLTNLEQEMPQEGPQSANSDFADPEVPTPIIQNKSRSRTGHRQEPVAATAEREERLDAAGRGTGTNADDEDERTNDSMNTPESYGDHSSQRSSQAEHSLQRLDNDTLWGLSENFMYNWDSLRLGEFVGSTAVQSFLEQQTLQQELLLPEQKHGPSKKEGIELSRGKRHHENPHQLHRQRQKINRDEHILLQQKQLSLTTPVKLRTPEWSVNHSWQVVLQSLALKTIPPPAGSPLHAVVLETDDRTLTNGTSKRSSSNSSPSSLTQIMSDLYETMCRQDAVTATHPADLPYQDESRFWTASECLDHMRQLETTVTDLALRQERILPRKNYTSRVYNDRYDCLD